MQNLRRFTDLLTNHEAAEVLHTGKSLGWPHTRLDCKALQPCFELTSKGSPALRVSDFVEPQSKTAWGLYNVLPTKAGSSGEPSLKLESSDETGGRGEANACAN